MAIPKKSQKKSLGESLQRIEKAVQFAVTPADQSSEPPVKTKIISDKKLGRPPLAGDRSAKVTFFLSPQTKERFEDGYLQEKLKRRRQGEKIDKSLLIEEALKDFLEKYGY